MKRIFPAVKLRPLTPPIDKREIGDAAIPGERRIHTSPSAPLQLGPLANERVVSSDVTLWRCTFWSGKFASLSSHSLARHAPSIWYYESVVPSNKSSFLLLLVSVTSSWGLGLGRSTGLGLEGSVGLGLQNIFWHHCLTGKQHEHAPWESQTPLLLCPPEGLLPPSGPAHEEQLLPIWYQRVKGNTIYIYTLVGN